MSSTQSDSMQHWEEAQKHDVEALGYPVDNDSVHLNWWAKYRDMIREPAAEFIGTAILIVFGNGVNCQVVLSGVSGVASSAKGDYLSINFGWAIGTALGVWVSGGISGGHINPAVTIALATWRDFPWRKVPAYVFAQVMGGLAGAALVYANYYHAINIFEGGSGVRTLNTAGLFSTYALDYLSNVSCFFSEVLATAVLLIVVLAIGDKRNCPPPAGLAPLVLFLLILGIGASLGMQTGYALNPARDLGPRLLTAMAGYEKTVFTFRNQYWLWCPIMGPIVGAQLGTIFYDLFIFQGNESLIDKTNKKSDRPHAPSAQRDLLPPGPGAVDKV